MNASSGALKKEIILPLVGLKTQVDPEAKPVAPTPRKKVIGAILLLIGIGSIISFFYLERGFLGWSALGLGILMVLVGFGSFSTMEPEVIELKGVIKITPVDILIKVGESEPLIFGVNNILKIDFAVNEYEAEDRAGDIFSKQNRYAVRSGENNFVAWQSGETVFRYQFKIGNEFSMKRAKLYLEEIKKEVDNKSQMG